MSSHYVPPPGQFLGYRPPIAPRRRSNVGLLVVMVTFVALLVSFGGFGVYVLVGDGFASSSPGATPSVSTSPAPADLD